ncbi:MAG: hypothetical protein JW990_08335 [Thermoleophilia bacterium]|nr:hypothetical protein [Thermoleophilia bacterium]
MKRFADLLLMSMVAHDPWMLPLADRYAATENSVAGLSAPPGQKATRAELLQLGRAIFDATLPAPEASPDCLLVEAGGIVLEDPDHLAALFGGETKPRKFGEKMSIPAGRGPGRPSDPEARVVVIDEEQGMQMLHNRQGPGGGAPWIGAKT